MYIPILIGGISILEQFRPYFRKHISNKLDHHEYVFINSIIIASIITIYLVYLFITEKTSINKIMKTYGSLTITEIIFLIGLSCLTVAYAILIYEMDKNHNTPFLNYIYLKSASVLALLVIGIFMYKESYKFHQFLGFALVIIGILLTSSKTNPFANYFK
jgi:uncharacterized membrane protein